MIPIPISNPAPSCTFPRSNNNSCSSKDKKRKLKNTGNVDIKNSSYAKIRLLLHHLRPLFLHVLHEPDFKDSEAAHGIRKGMKRVMDLYKHMQVEGNQMKKVETSTCQPLVVEKSNDKCFGGLLTKVTQDGVDKTCVDDKVSNLQVSTGETLDDAWPRNSYIMGGSVADRNFVTFVNRKAPEYYGVTKESFRLCHDKS